MATLTDQTLSTIGSLSAELAAAQSTADELRLAALVAACRTVEAQALAALAGRVTQGQLLTAQQEALDALGW